MKIKIFNIIFLSFLVFSFFIPFFAQAETKSSASLYFVPATSSVEVGKTTQVRFVVNAGVPINLVESTLSFSNNTLEFSSFSKSGSIINLWFNEPTYSQQNGSISFSGGIPNPGFTGEGRILIINFKAKASGTAWVKISGAQVLANDGLGTDILSSRGQASFTCFETGLPKPTPTEPKPEITPSQLKVSSSTHPDQQKWYLNKNPMISWPWNSNISNFSFIFDQKEKTIPDNAGEGLNNNISYSDVKDGIWYFHLKARTATGWSMTSHFKIQIDSQLPQDLKIIFPKNEDIYTTTPLVNVSANDSLSGIAYFEEKTDQGDFIKIDKTEFKIPKTNPGDHTLSIKAYDQAGNFAEKSENFKIILLPTPTIDHCTREVLSATISTPLIVRGEAAPLSDIIVSIAQQEGDQKFEETTQTDKQGNWAIIYKEQLPPGEYFVYATVHSPEQASSPSKKVRLKVIKTGIEFLGHIIPSGAIIFIIFFLLAIIVILIALLMFFKRKFKKYDTLLKDFLEKKNRGFRTKK
ncbi:MAG: cohesin domain-containing protein [Patescibacteria group bacterium]|nr:cohesin domain-containing protein [Patescibacteria group bacterium]MDD5164294.1 cohesin domain-containing protein [Patescibacteria group bacterium]MDD5534741.1 cohesin domain-containing protein [Patescibacteria group bacterium]